MPNAPAKSIPFCTFRRTRTRAGHAAGRLIRFRVESRISLRSTTPARRYVMAQASKAIPTPRVFSLLKAANPGPAKSDKADTGKRVNSNSKRTFDATIAAAKQAKSAQQFAKLLGGGASEAVAAG